MSFELYERETCARLFGKRVGYPSLLQAPLKYESGIDIFDEIQQCEDNLFAGELLISLGAREKGLVIGAFDGRSYYHTGLFHEQIRKVLLSDQALDEASLQADEKSQLLSLIYETDDQTEIVVLRCLRREREETERFLRLAYPQRFEIQDPS